MSIFQDFRSHARNSLAPATVTICCGLILSFLIVGLNLGNSPRVALAFTTDFSQPWGMLTYPFAYPGGAGDFVWLVLEVLWLWGMGGSVERELGTPKFVALWIGLTALGAVAFAIGAALLQVNLPLVGAMIPIGSITVVWGTRNPTLPVMLMMILPIIGRWLAWLSVGIIFFNTVAMYRAPILGLFACAPALAAYLFASNRLPGIRYSRGSSGPVWSKRSKADSPVAKKTERMDSAYYDDVRRREKEREERERLRKLFESSIDDSEK